ncbi:MAG: hypothetical protein M3N22_01395 [Acidobacteriota bacterium]|nr:hypothetical protein [Acidobacteriota bacterium]
MLKQNSDPRIRVLAVWEPILPTDYSSPGTAVLNRLTDSRVVQYWDKNHLFAQELGRKLDADKSHPQPSCCTRNGIQWDEVAVYGPETSWRAQLPRALYLGGPVVKSRDFLKVVNDLLAHPPSSK